MKSLLHMGLIVLGVIVLIALIHGLNSGGEQRLEATSTSELRRIVEQEPDNARAQFHLAFRLGTQEGRYEEAYRLLRPLAQKQSDAEDVQYALAQCALSTKRLEEAVEALNRVVKVNPRRSDARRQLASVCSQCGLFPEVAMQLEPLLAERPEQPPLWDMLGRAYLRMGDIAQAESAYRLLIKHMPMMGGSHVGAGFVALARGDLETAEAKFREGLKAYRSEERAYVGLARIYRRKSWTDVNLPRVIQEMQQAVQIFSQDPIVHLVLGKAYLRQNERAKALQELRTAARLRGAPAETWQLLASLHRQAGKAADAASAQKIYQKALRTEQEEQQLKQAVARSPRDAERQFALARFYTAHGDLPQAWIHFTFGLKERHDERAAQEAQRVRQRLLAGEGVDLIAFP